MYNNINKQNDIFVRSNEIFLYKQINIGNLIFMVEMIIEHFTILSPYEPLSPIRSILCKQMREL